MLAKQDTVRPRGLLDTHIVIFFALMESRSWREQKLAFLHPLQEHVIHAKSVQLVELYAFTEIV